MWSRHPKEYAGNTAVRLITVGGTQNDYVAGAMQPTPALLACPYVQQVLACFNTVWSRSRLMRIEGGGPCHSTATSTTDWTYRVRVHIPVVTRPEVLFLRRPECAHRGRRGMDLRQLARYTVLNPTADARIHWWRTRRHLGILAPRVEGQSENSEAADPNVATHRIDPAARPKLMVERFKLGHCCRRRKSNSWHMTIRRLGRMDSAPESARP